MLGTGIQNHPHCFWNYVALKIRFYPATSSCNLRTLISLQDDYETGAFGAVMGVRSESSRTREGKSIFVPFNVRTEEKSINVNLDSK